MVQHKNTDLSESLEDYLETIFNLSDRSGIARAKDVAETLGVAKSSVTGALRLLAEKGMVNYRPYDYITLTKKGAVEANRVAGKHSVLKSFFIDVLDIESDVAQEAACKAEHALGPAIIGRLVRFIDLAMQPDKEGVSLAGRFHELCNQSSENTSAKARKWKQNKNK
jgi:DtxR family Mn-dependent transcriptional regulator